MNDQAQPKKTPEETIAELRLSVAQMTRFANYYKEQRDNKEQELVHITAEAQKANAQLQGLAQRLHEVEVELNELRGREAADATAGAAEPPAAVLN